MDFTTKHLKLSELQTIYQEQLNKQASLKERLARLHQTANENLERFKSEKNKLRDVRQATISAKGKLEMLKSINNKTKEIYKFAAALADTLQFEKEETDLDEPVPDITKMVDKATQIVKPRVMQKEIQALDKIITDTNDQYKKLIIDLSATLTMSNSVRYDITKEAREYTMHLESSQNELRVSKENRKKSKTGVAADLKPRLKENTRILNELMMELEQKKSILEAERVAEAERESEDERQSEVEEVTEVEIEADVSCSRESADEIAN